MLSILEKQSCYGTGTLKRFKTCVKLKLGQSNVSLGTPSLLWTVHLVSAKSEFKGHWDLPLWYVCYRGLTLVTFKQVPYMYNSQWNGIFMLKKLSLLYSIQILFSRIYFLSVKSSTVVRKNIETCSHMMHDEHKWLRVWRRYTSDLHTTRKGW